MAERGWPSHWTGLRAHLDGLEEIRVENHGRTFWIRSRTLRVRRNLRVKRLPGKTVERLRALTREELDRHLLVVAQFRLVGDQLVSVTPTEPIHPDGGVRRNDEVMQFGLTNAEIGHIWGRIQEVLKKVDEEKIVLF